MKPNSILLRITLFFFSGIIYSQEYKIVTEPDWVKSVGIPKNSSVEKYGISSGYYTTLANYQINLDENAFFTHEVLKVLSHSGITEASQLLIVFDTSYQKLNIHHLYIWRNGVKIDRTNSLSFEIMNNEYSLHRGIYLGKVTAYDNLDDIRKNDLIDFAYTITGKNPIFNNEKYLFIPLETNNPIDFSFIRLIYSKNKDYKHKWVGCDSSIKISNVIVNKYREIEMTMKDLKATKFEENIPSWIIPYKYFMLSSFKTWKEVNLWAQDVFALNAELNLESVFKEIFTGNETKDEQINKIINYVQDDIRYMGIETGIGSIKPSSPDLVVKQRFGDCKDKSLLLTALLKKIGVSQAYPALVSVRMQDGLNKFYPSNEIFDHCIVKFEIDSTSYWVDPTIMQQGGDYKNSSLENYGPALVIGKPSDTLTEIPPLHLKSGIKVKEELTVKSFSAPSTLEIKSTRYGLEADKRRVFFEQYAANDLSKAVSEDLESLFPTVNQTTDIIIHDDVNRNNLTTIYHYEVDGFWKDGDKLSDKGLAGYWLFKFEPLNLYGYFKMFVGTKRKYDYALPFPLNFNYRIVFHFPKDILIYDKYIKYDNIGFFYDEKTEQLSSTSFQVTYNFNTKASYIPAAEYDKVYEDKKKIVDNLPLMIYFNK